jgi:conjugative transfer signal peptidase TraF
VDKIKIKIKHWWPLRIMAVAFGMALLFYFQILEPPVYINTSHSMPIGFYLVVPFGEIKKNDCVVIAMPEQVKPLIAGRKWSSNEDIPLVKKAVGLPGDEFTITDSEITVNGQYIGPVSLMDSEGLPLPKIRGSYRIEEGMFLPISDYSTSSFDGRYFGTVPLSAIKKKVIPLLTF